MREEYKVVGFYSKTNLELCRLYSEGHENVLKEHGFEHFKTNNNAWYNDDGTYVVLALKGNEPVGGVRLVKKGDKKRLPLEEAILSIDGNIAAYLESLNNEKVYEICGLWNSKLVAGLKLSHLLSRFGLIMAPHLGYNVSICFIAQYTFNISKKLGYSMVKEIGKEGYFNYPTSDFLAAVWIKNDIISLEGCEENEKQRILSLRKNPNQLFIENPGFKELQIKYELFL